MQVLINWIENSLGRIRDMKPENGLSPRITSGLRELQLSVKPLIFGNVSSETQFIAFFLNSYIDDLFMDLLGDIPDDADGILEKIRNDLFNDIVTGFNQLLETLKNGRNPLPAIVALVSFYSKAVSKLNYQDKERRDYE